MKSLVLAIVLLMVVSVAHAAKPTMFPYDIG